MLRYSELFFGLSRFDGGAAAAGDGAGGEGTTGGTQAVPSAAGKERAKGKETQHILYGKQPAVGDPGGGAGTGESADKKTAEAPEEKTPEERRSAYRALVEGEYKDLYTEDTQNIINRRFKETEGLREEKAKSQAVLGLLMGRYNIEDGDLDKLQKAIEEDDAYWADAAEEAGMSVEQYKQLQKLKHQNAQLVNEERQRQGRERAEQQARQWFAEAQALKAKFPKFDLATEVGDPQFLAMLKAGTPVEHAYKVLHFDELMGDAVSVTAAQQEQKVVAQVRARGARPVENGTAAQSAFTVKDDVSKLSKKDRAEIARRALMGEKITF